MEKKEGNLKPDPKIIRVLTGFKPLLLKGFPLRYMTFMMRTKIKMTTKATLEIIAVEDTLEKQQPLPLSIRDSFKTLSWSYTYIFATKF